MYDQHGTEDPATTSRPGRGAGRPAERGACGAGGSGRRGGGDGRLAGGGGAVVGALVDVAGRSLVGPCPRAGTVGGGQGDASGDHGRVRRGGLTVDQAAVAVQAPAAQRCRGGRAGPVVDGQPDPCDRQDGPSPGGTGRAGRPGRVGQTWFDRRPVLMSAELDADTAASSTPPCRRPGTACSVTATLPCRGWTR